MLHFWQISSEIAHIGMELDSQSVNDLSSDVSLQSIQLGSPNARRSTEQALVVSIPCGHLFWVRPRHIAVALMRNTF